MALAEFTPERRDLKFKKLELSVRGLTSEDVGRLITVHLADIEQTAKRLGAVRAAQFSRSATDEFFAGLVTDFPALVAEVISVSADEPDAADNARRIPIGTQIAILHAIWNLSLEEAGDLKNLFASLVSGVRSALPAPTAEALMGLAGQVVGQTTQLQ